MTCAPTVIANDLDDHVDDEIAACLGLSSPQSFFLFAGAGSGKTRSLVTALQHIQSKLSDSLKARGKRVAVITFTNAASDEIKRRLLFDPLIDVRTIHSFAWSVIDGLDRDIREWLRTKLADDIEQLQAEEAKGRKGTKASVTRLKRIASKTKRLQNLDKIKHFVYSPTGDNRTQDALNHAEVLQLTAYFLSTKPAMQSILSGRYPILLIDESQDTNERLMDALIKVQAIQKGKFTLGLLGDMMQRIYNDGKDRLGMDLPADWAKPVKKLNHRCPKRIVRLINKIRHSVDGQSQVPRDDAKEGLVRLFLLPSDLANKSQAERAVAARMRNLTGDLAWSNEKAVKTLTLEHRMAAARMGFLEMFVPLYNIQGWRTSFLRGTLPISRFFTEDVLSLVRAKQANDRFAIARIAKALSPLLSVEALRAADEKKQHLQKVTVAIDTLMALWNDGADPSLSQVLRCIGDTDLLVIPDSLKPNAFRDDLAEEDADDPQGDREAAIDKFLVAPFSQVEPFATYLSGLAHFDTHQGVKGLEFDRVMVIMDDEEARGFLFKYEDLFGGKPPGDKTVDSTKRLFYVTCSRAKQSLALVAYTGAPDKIRRFVIREGWFNEDEIVVGVPA